MFEMISLAFNEVFYYTSYLYTNITASATFKVVFWIGLAFGILFFAIKLIRSTVWGR